MKTPILIVNFNGGEMLLNTLASIYAHEAGAEYVIYLVDNGSVDNSYKVALAIYPEIKLITSPVNLGFGRGNNLGLEKIMSEGIYENVVLLNPDMKVTKNWLKNIILPLKNDPLTAAVAPLILYEDRFDIYELKTNNKKLYFSFPDYRALGNVVGNAKNTTKEIEFENDIYIKTNKNTFLFISNVLEKEIKFKVYDESLDGYKLDFAGKQVESKVLSSKLKKVGVKLKLIKNKNKIINYKINKASLIPVMENQEIVNSFGSFFRKKATLPDNRYYGQLKSEIRESNGECELFHAACVAINLTALKRVGLFDPAYFMYYEESDLGMRMKEAGFRFITNANSVVYHRERGNRSEKTAGYMRESQKYFQSKWFGKAKS